jgi:hypothetical protein
MFKDLDQNHWAYQAVESLRAKNIVVGYPDGYFRGKRTLTRYEFAVALDRALKQIQTTAGPKGDTGPTGPPGDAGPVGPAGPPGMTPEEVATFRRLLNEFRDELAAMGNTVQGINRKLDALARDVAALRAQWDKAPKLSGGTFVGIRSDRAAGPYADYNGRIIGGPDGMGRLTLVNTPAVIHWFGLDVKAPIPGGGTIDAEITSNNYKNFEGGSLGQIGPVYNTDPAADTYIHKLEITTPFTGLGRGSSLTIGRFGYRIGHLSLWKPNVDTYFNNPFEENGLYYMDGAKLSTNFGSVSFEAVGAQTKSATGTDGEAWNSPLAGATSPALFTPGGPFGGMGHFPGLTYKPVGQPDQGQMTVDELAALNLGLGFNLLDRAGHLRVTALGLQNTGASVPGVGFNNVLVLGADGDIKLADRLSLTADWAKSIVGNGRFNTLNIPGTDTQQNNAFNATVGYGAGGLSLNAGYRYIDPLFYAPGYWGRIGNWINPTNIQGPTFRAAYDVSQAFGVNVGGDFFTAARNRAGDGGLSTDDNINRVLMGLRWDVAKNFRTTVDWEGVYWSLSGTHSGVPELGTGNVHPTEQYITLGTGYNLTSNTILKLSYQIGDFDGHGAFLSGPTTHSTFNVFTGQVSVKF